MSVVMNVLDLEVMTNAGTLTLISIGAATMDAHIREEKSASVESVEVNICGMLGLKPMMNHKIYDLKFKSQTKKDLCMTKYV